jgi:hypothetical protein
MFTLRDLLMLLNPEYAQKWREKQASKLGTYSRAPKGEPDYMYNVHEGDYNQGLREILKYKNHQIDKNPSNVPDPGLEGLTSDLQRYIYQMHLPPVKGYTPYKGSL